MPDDFTFRILVVCTGNLYRSPLFGGLLESGLAAMAPNEFTVDTAGTRVRAGLPMDRRVAGILQDHGSCVEDFHTKEISTRMLSSQDLVITATRAHRNQVAGMHPGLLTRTFTMLELARILPYVSGISGAGSCDRWLKALPEAARRRSSSELAPHRDDVADPAGRSRQVFDQMVDQVLPAVDALIAWEHEHQGRGAAS